MHPHHWPPGERERLREMEGGREGEKRSKVEKGEGVKTANKRGQFRIDLIWAISATEMKAQQLHNAVPKIIG